jgi:hypothetical protein
MKSNGPRTDPWGTPYPIQLLLASFLRHTRPFVIKGAIQRDTMSDDYWGFRICPSSDALKIIKYNVSETGSVPAPMGGERGGDA